VQDPAPQATAARTSRLLQRFPETAPQLIAGCEASADPELALAGVERYADAVGDLPAEAELRETLVALAAGSRMLVGLLGRHPAALRRLARHPHRHRPRPEGNLGALLRRAARRLPPGDTAALHALLRRVRHREMARIALRDLTGAPVSEVTAELSTLADASLEVAIDFHHRRLAAIHGAPDPAGSGFCALAMGKLGARELNFSSDIDLIFVYRADGETSGPRPINHFAYYARLAESVVEALGRPTEEGMVFRVDLNLRPDGRSGPIVNSVRATELYYQSFGRTWERSALIRARPAAGERAVGKELLALLEPFIWRRSLDLGAVDEIKAMKARIDARAGAEGREDLKLGQGGIREAEFLVVALQLVHGGRRPELREQAVVPALDRLLFAGLLSARDREALADAYLFLRRAEHRIQMMDGRQTHRLPPEPERPALGRRMGFDDPRAFEAALAGHREAVSRSFSALLGSEPRAAPATPERAELTLLADSQVPEGRRVEIARRRGFADPERAVASLDLLSRRRTPFSPEGAPDAAIALLEEALAAPDPDQSLRHLADFAATLRDPRPYFRLLEERPQAARLLLSLFGTSDFLSQRFLRHPELLDGLLRQDQVVLHKDLATLRGELTARLGGAGEPGSMVASGRGEAGPDPVEWTLGELRRFKNEEVLRIALADVAGALDLDEVVGQLSDLAEVSLQACLAAAETEARARDRLPPGRLCVIALGKLGGREIGYHSDLDLMFVYRSGGNESDPRGHGEAYAKLAQRFLAFLQMPLREGALYKVDTRLRPSGSQGTLVTSTEGFAQYHAGDSQLWERQSLLRARCVAGDGDLFRELAQGVIEPVVYRRPTDTAALAAELRRMRERIRVEVAREDRGYNPKSGLGGVNDVEFATQYLQLAHGFDRPAIREPSTSRALAALRKEGLLSADAHDTLSGGYRFLRRLELRLRIVHDYSIDHLPAPGPALTRLARRLGYAGADADARLLADYQRVTRGVRGAFAAILGTG
jgi:glutamate-ammonia-ligase adenylyltransferase